jgi:hypothetical protein
MLGKNDNILKSNPVVSDEVTPGSGSHDHLEVGGPGEQALPECPPDSWIVISPLGWSSKGRLIVAAAAAAFLWLAVAWALGWLR